ncbi:Asp-tRNA(Asn)/Glu-tRNA(Gln) amidotransferase subunit GatA [Lacipirellula sp.]|uniref:Asp-tRNA(Asn)/Glu-tRNA(Gln) amidotransferase subunit GatA n=1 Tax=Lacipirellula sp. TaxID=2691419 RepID=UPI003D10F963
MSIVDRPATELRKSLAAGELTSVELTQACLDRIAAHDQSIGAFLRVDGERALEQAKSVDKRRAAGETLGPLAGIPVAVKDVLCDSQAITTCASQMLAEFRPPYDSTVVARLKQADAVLLGRTNMDEFAMGGSTENSAFQQTRNPWDPTRTPGGSSGGSAAAVAARFAPLAIGTDTGGSIRQPAGLCGIVGMKPTYGRVSRYGLVAFASSLDQVGPFATTTEDAALLLEAVAGHDPRDSTSINRPTPPYTDSINKPLAGLKLGIVPEHFGAGLDPEVAAAVKSAIEVYKSLGAEVKEVALPHGKYGVAAYYVIAPSEASSNLARYDGVHYGFRADQSSAIADLAAERQASVAAGNGAAADNVDSPLVRMYRSTREAGFGPEVKRRIMLGAYALSAGYYDAYYLKALKVRRLIRRDFDEAFKQVDLIVGPVTAGPAFKLGEMVDDPLAMYLVDLYTVSANLAGIPAISLPCGMTKAGLPIGLQLQGPPLEEDRLLRGARMFEAATDWHTKQPTLAGAK